MKVYKVDKPECTVVLAGIYLKYGDKFQADEADIEFSLSVGSVVEASPEEAEEYLASLPSPAEEPNPSPNPSEGEGESGAEETETKTQPKTRSKSQG